MNMSKSCRYCNKGGLTWNFNILYQKWELLESNGNKHKCLILPRKSKANTEIRPDPKIEKALKIFQKQLQKEGKKDYFLQPSKNYTK